MVRFQERIKIELVMMGIGMELNASSYSRDFSHIAELIIRLGN